MASFTLLQKSSIFKLLATKTFYEVGLEYELDKKYSNKGSMINAIGRVYNEVKNDPQVFGIAPDLVEIVAKAIEGRKTNILKKSENTVTLRDKKELTDGSDIKSLVLISRDKSAVLLNKKLDLIGKSKKALESISLADLAKVVGQLFDKGQVIQGLATEHIAVLSKIDPNMKPEDAIDLVLKMREKQIESK